MDFAIVGLGVGALAVLIGLGARVLAPNIWPIRHDRSLPPRVLANRVALIRFTHAGGLVLALAGTALLVLTVLAIALGVSDRAGAIVVMAAITAGVLGAIAWGVTYARRYHPRPLPPPPRLRATVPTRPASGAPAPRTIRASRAIAPATPAAIGSSASASLDDPDLAADAADPAAADVAAAGAAVAAEDANESVAGDATGVDAATAAVPPADYAAMAAEQSTPPPVDLQERSTTAIAGPGTRRGE